MIFIGIDWSEQHHEVEVQAGSGKVLKRLRVNADIAGLSRLQEVITDAAGEPSQVVIGIESDHGLLVEALVGSGYRLYPINPVTSARAREGESPSRSKSDHGDAHVLANLVRTRRQDLRPMAGDSQEAQAIRVRARSHLRAIRLQQRVRNQLRSALAKFFPGALPLLGDDPRELRDALAVLSLAANPGTGPPAFPEQDPGQPGPSWPPAQPGPQGGPDSGSTADSRAGTELLQGDFGLLR